MLKMGFIMLIISILLIGQQLTFLINEIRYETERGANTAERIGSTLQSIVYECLGVSCVTYILCLILLINTNEQQEHSVSRKL